MWFAVGTSFLFHRMSTPQLLQGYTRSICESWNLILFYATGGAGEHLHDVSWNLLHRAASVSFLDTRCGES
jgi:hypothetical protein